jgi:hypothetical protein
VRLLAGVENQEKSMNHPHTFAGRLRELSPFEITVPEVSEAAAGWPKVSTEYVSTEDLYGCVDWYQYPGQAEQPEKKPKAVAER